jgi:hypothetical protein
MAKKKKIPQRRAEWTCECTVEVLAWLDHTLQHDDVDFAETAAQHLKQSCLKEFTLTQIEDKLRRLWKGYGSNDVSREDTGWRKNIFTSGSACVVGLDPAEKKDIASRVRELEAGYDASHQFPSQRLRRRSRSTTTGSPYRSNLELSKNPKNRVTAHSRYRTQTLSLTPSTVKRESETNDNSPSREGAARKRIRGTKSVRAI